MALTLIRHDNRFRLEGQGIAFDWLPDTKANRKSTLVFLRQLTDDAGKSLFTHQELAQVVESSNRQAAGHPIQDFRECGTAFLWFWCRRKKLDFGVVQPTQAALLRDPFATGLKGQEGVNAAVPRGHPA